MKNVALAAALVALSGCNPIAGRYSGSGEPVEETPAAPVVLSALTIAPAQVVIVPQGEKLLKAVAQYSDGHSEPAVAEWENPSPLLVELSATTGSSVIVKGLELVQEVVLTVTFQEKTAKVKVRVAEWTPPNDPGPVHGCDAGILSRYPMGDGAPIPVALDLAGGASLGWNATTEVAYTCGWDAAHAFNEIKSVDLATGATVILAGGLSSGLTSLDVDSLGRVWVCNGRTGELYRHDPVTGETLNLGVFRTQQVGMAIGPDGAPYTTPMLVGGVGIYRVNVAAGTTKAWAASAPDHGAIAVTCGIAFNMHGEAFQGDFQRPSIYRSSDLNGDGDALDGMDMDGDGLDDNGGPVAETVLFTTLPIPVFAVGEVVWGLAAVGPSVLINVISPNADHAGIWWAVDRNGDGDALDDGEVTRYSAFAVNQGQPTNCIIAPKE